MGGLKNGKRENILATVPKGDAQLLFVPYEKASAFEVIGFLIKNSTVTVWIALG